MAGLFSLLFGPSPVAAGVIGERQTDDGGSSSSTSGSLSLVSGKPALTFKYATDSPGAKNWVAIYYSAADGPEKQEFVQPSLTWSYAPEKSGEVQVATDKLQPGSYRAYFLADDGYKWLAKPIAVAVGGKGDVSFIVEEITLKNARRDTPFEARISGLLSDAPDGDTKFTKSNYGLNDQWVRVSTDGVISGTPAYFSGSTEFAIEAAASDGSTASIEITIPVRRAHEPLVEELKVMSFNLWYGGREVNDFHRKQVRVLANSNVDVVGLQESGGGHATRLGNALGWYSWQSHDSGIVSRYPIVETYPEQQAGGSVRIALDGDDSQIILHNCHLGAYPYGPYGFCFDKSPLEKVLEIEEQSRRTPQIIEILKAMKPQLDNADNIPVLLTGDFNAPSHLDWTKAARDQHCGAYDVPWPTSVLPEEAGLIDSYRLLHPNPVHKPGNTWSPIYLDNEGRPEPLDRIDFIYHKGKSLKALHSDAVVVGSPKAQPNHKDNEWPSDHKAVITVYKLVSHSNLRAQE